MSTGVRNARTALLVTAILLCLLATSSPPAQATFPGRPGLIVFNHIPTLDDNGNYVGGLYAIHPKRKHLRQLTDNPWDDEASFAPSGQRLVFSRSFGPEPGIYSLDIRSNKTRRLTWGLDDRSPAFGPRGLIVFSRPDPRSGSYDLFLRTPTGRLRRLTSTSTDDVDPVFTPDGSEIFFTQDHLDIFPSPPSKISLIRIDGGGLRDIKGLTEASRVDISPAGRELVFQYSKRLPNGEARHGIWTRHLGGGKPTLRAEDMSMPAYSPSGEEIAYSFYREMWLLSLSRGSEPRLLSEWDAVNFYPEAKITSEPAWQPLP